jgi:putative ABC transport system substrate-binding protein
VKRRNFITLLGGAAAWPFGARAQQRDRMRTIGVLTPFAADDAEGHARLTAFAQGLQQLGWTVGQNIRIDYRWGDGQPASMRKLADELASLAPDVILAIPARPYRHCFKRPAPCRSSSRPSLTQ